MWAMAASKGAGPLFDLLVECSDALFEEVDVRKQLVEQEALVRSDAATEALGQQVTLALQPIVGAGGDGFRAILASDQRTQEAASVETDHVGDDVFELDVGALQDSAH